MNKIHQYLENNSPGYSRWHQSPHRDVHHMLVLVAVCMALAVYINNQLNYTLASVSNQPSVNALTGLSLPERAKKAELIINGLANETSTTLETNEYGDKYLITKVKVNVKQTLKGPSTSSLDLYMIGGTLEGITMRSSKDPAPLNEGEEGVIFVTKDKKGRLTVAGGESGLLKKQTNGRYEGLTLKEIKAGLK